LWESPAVCNDKAARVISAAAKMRMSVPVAGEERAVWGSSG
jgi:hypothetical protein